MKKGNITEAQLDEVLGIIVDPKALINIDERDVRYVMSGKSGIMYYTQQGDKDKREFIKGTFQELLEDPFVKKCHYMLLSMGMPADAPIEMNDIDYINKFLGSIANDALEAKWGIRKNGAGQGMTIYLICTNDILK